jgi:hypothetical protein
MIKKIATLFLVLVSVGSFAHAENYNDNDNDNGAIAYKRRNNDDFRRKHNYPRQQENYDDNQEEYQQQNNGNQQQGNGNADDQAIVKAVENRRRVDFVEGGGMVVVKLLPDDNNGLQHQKWVVRLSNGATMQAVYNTDMCDRVPLKVGDVVAMGGQFVWTNQGALLHWLHFDPRNNRPDGYVSVNGKDYCKDGPRH